MNVVASLLLAGPGAGQEPAERPPAGTLSAAALVEAYAERGDPAALRVWTDCRGTSARGDSLLDGLLALDPTPQRVVELSVVWGGLVAICNDSTLDAWYRARIAAARDAITLMHLTSGLLAHATAANAAAVRSVVRDTTLRDQARTSMLWVMTGRWPDPMRIALTPEQRVDLVADLYEHSRVPHSFFYDESFTLTRSPAADYWWARMTRELTEHPARPDAVPLLLYLREEMRTGPGRDMPRWAARFEAALASLVADTAASPELTQLAGRTLRAMHDPHFVP